MHEHLGLKAFSCGVAHPKDIIIPTIKADI